MQQSLGEAPATSAPSTSASAAPTTASSAPAPGTPAPAADPATDVADACAYDPVAAQEALDAGEPPTRG